MDVDGFSVRIGEAHRLMIPIECRRKLDLKPGQIYDITIVSSDRMVKENFLAKIHSSGRVVIPKLVYETKKFAKGQLLTVYVSTK